MNKLSKNKKNEHPVRHNGIYGGETNGANPLEWNLRSTICAQLRAAGFFCSMDVFSDQSASWIEVYKTDPNKLVEGKVLSMSIQFNYEGSIITDIRLFEETLSLKSSGTSKIF